MPIVRINILHFRCLRFKFTSTFSNHKVPFLVLYFTDQWRLAFVIVFSLTFCPISESNLESVNINKVHLIQEKSKKIFFSRWSICCIYLQLKNWTSCHNSAFLLVVINEKNNSNFQPEFRLFDSITVGDYFPMIPYNSR